MHAYENVEYDDYGLDHTDYYKPDSGHITWSDAEVEYIKHFLETNHGTQIFQRCLQSILSNPNKDIRRIFHKKHLRNSSVIRDGVKRK